MKTLRLVGAFLSTLFAMTPANAENIEFIAEHLPEIAMDNRYASLPLWAPAPEATEKIWGRSITASYARLRSGQLSLAGPALSVGFNRRLNDSWALGVFGFLDELRFSGGPDQRPLDVTFASAVPLLLPAAAQFTQLTGTARHIGLGFAMRRNAQRWLLGRHQWTAGLLWQQMALRDYRTAYRVLNGANLGAIGYLDYSATYAHLTPFAGVAWPRDRGRWVFAPHVQIAIPLPRRSVVGRISGPNFDIRGDAASVGNGKHFGDASLTIGWDVTYQPWGLTVDVGSTVTQYLIEPRTHKGVNQIWLVSVRWSD